MTLRHQIIALAIVPLVISILAITTFITWQSANLAKNSIDTFEQNMLKTKEAEILNLTNLALSAIQTIYDNAGSDDEAAKQQEVARPRILPKALPKQKNRVNAADPVKENSD